jgi:flagella basal body P-ring formation protein FlgA
MRIALLLLLLLAVQVLRPAAAEEPTLNLQVSLNAGVIVVGDLWRNAGAKAAAIVGPAPPPGRSFVIEATQLAYIARLFDVQWKPFSGVERAVIERGGRVLEREEMLEPLRHGLMESGLPEGTSVELANVAPVLVPPLSFPLVRVEGLSVDPASDRFAANLAISSEDMQTQMVRVSGRAVQMGSAVVANRRLLPDDIIAEADIRLARLPERSLKSDVARSLGQVVGQSARRVVAMGQPIALSEIGPAMMIAKGATVVLTMETPGISIAAQVLAMGSGGSGDTIQVMNPMSRAVVAARVTGPGRAVVAPGGSPLVPTAGQQTHGPEVAQ